MSLLLLIAVVLAIIASGMLFVFCVQAPITYWGSDVVRSLCILISVILIVIFAVSIVFAIRKSKKMDKPYYLIVIAVFFTVCAILLAIKNQLYDYLISLFSAIAPDVFGPVNIVR